MGVWLMKRKNNMFLSIGLLVFALTLNLKQFIPDYPHFLHGFGLGLALCFVLIGGYLLTHDMPRWMAAKSQWIRNIFHGPSVERQ